MLLRRRHREFTAREKALLILYCEQRLRGKSGIDAQTTAVLGSFNTCDLGSATRLSYDYFSRFRILSALARAFGGEDPEVKELIFRAQQNKRISQEESRQLEALIPATA